VCRQKVISVCSVCSLFKIVCIIDVNWKVDSVRRTCLE
jgi:hypothetical protein